MLQVTHNRQCNGCLLLRSFDHGIWSMSRSIRNQDVLHCQSTTLHVRTRSAIQYSQLRRFRYVWKVFDCVFDRMLRNDNFNFRQSLQLHQWSVAKFREFRLSNARNCLKKVKTALYWPCPILCSISTVIISAAITALTEWALHVLLAWMFIMSFDVNKEYDDDDGHFYSILQQATITSSYHMSTKHIYRDTCISTTYESQKPSAIQS